MHSFRLLPAALAIAGAFAADDPCSSDISVTSLDQVIKCEVVKANVIVDPALSGSLSMEGPQQITGDLIIVNATKLISFTSSTLTTVGGTLQLQGLELLSNFNMQSLQSVKMLVFKNLNQLSGLELGKQGVTKANSITVEDTFISDLSGLNVATTDNMTISNNRRLSNLDSKLKNVTYTLSVVKNAANMQIKMNYLETVGTLDFRGIQSFDAPLLMTADRLSCQESPELLSVSANNLTSIKDSLNFDNNKKLTNISFTSLKKISGDLTIRNCTALTKIDKFDNLESIGSVLMAGSFDTIEFPKLNDIKGTVTVTSTTDISNFCSVFDNMKKQNTIQGKESCTSNNAQALENGKGGTSGGSSGKGKNGTDSAATSIGVNTAMFGLAAAAAGFAQLF